MGLFDDELASEMIDILAGGDRARTAHGEAPAMFDNGHVTVVTPEGMEVSDFFPMITLTAADAARLQLQRGATVEVEPKDSAVLTFKVSDMRPDGAGFVKIPLETP